MAIQSKIKTILMTTDAVGGVWIYCFNLARELNSLGINVVLASMGKPPSDFQINQYSDLKNVKIFESSFKLEWEDSPWNDVDCAGKCLLDLDFFFSPQGIHLNAYSHS